MHCGFYDWNERTPYESVKLGQVPTALKHAMPEASTGAEALLHSVATIAAQTRITRHARQATLRVLMFGGKGCSLGRTSVALELAGDLTVNRHVIDAVCIFGFTAMLFKTWSRKSSCLRSDPCLDRGMKTFDFALLLRGLGLGRSANSIRGLLRCLLRGASSHRTSPEVDHCLHRGRGRGSQQMYLRVSKSRKQCHQTVADPGDRCFAQNLSLGWTSTGMYFKQARRNDGLWMRPPK
jgi:hypothetical protein